MSEVLENTCDEINANYKLPFTSRDEVVASCEPPSTSKDELPSFQQLAELSRSRETASSKRTKVQSVIPESCLQTIAFRQPQNRPRILSCESDEEKGEKEKDKLDFTRSMEALKVLMGGSNTESEGEEQRRLKGMECADMKPSLFNFKGFLETLSLDLHLKYSMDNPRRGLTLIFNHDVFDTHLGLARRSGSNSDVKQLKRHFGKLGFEVYVYANLHLKEIRKVVKIAATMDHRDADGFVCIFLTHGDDNSLIYAYDESVYLSELLDEFRGDRCRSLLGKPKIFIIQACRGRELEVGVLETDGGLEDTDAKNIQPRIPDTMADTGTRATIPAGADFIVCYSVVEGYFSFRDTVSGSWYIQALCQVLADYGTTLEFTALMTLVSRMVAEKCVRRSADPRMLGRKQMPCFVSMLTKQLMFTQK